MSEFSNPTSRRNVLRLGGLGLGAAFLAACSDAQPAGISGVPPTTDDAPVLPVRPATDKQVQDAQLQIQTMASLELLAAQVYREHGSSVQHPELSPIVAGLAAVHSSAADAVSALADDPVDVEPNVALDEILVQPRLKMLSTETGSLLSRGVLSLLRDIESTLTATYINSVGVVLEPATRKALMAHGAACARRVTLLSAGGEGRLPDAMYPPTDLVPGAVLVSDEEAEGEGAGEDESAAETED